MLNKYIIKKDIDLLHDSKEEVFELLKINNSSIEDLLDELKEGFYEVNAALRERLYERDMDGYHDIGLRFSPIACCLYDRLHGEGEEPRIPGHLAVNRYQETGVGPDRIPFWADPDAIRVFYESLKKDGRYDKKAVSQ